MQKEFGLDDTINLPAKTEVYTHKVNDYFLHIAKKNPSWVITNDDGNIIFQELLAGKTLRQAVGELKSLRDLTDDQLVTETQKVLKELELNQFYAVNTPRKEGPLILQIYVTNGCNLHCKQCYMNAGKKLADELTTDEIKKIIDDFSGHTISSITFTGGEPLIRSDIVDLLKHAKSKGHNVALLTNGTLITEQIAENIKPYIHNIQVSLDGSSAEVNDSIRGKGVFDKVVTAIKYFRTEKDISVHIGMTILNENMDDLYQNLPAFLKEINSDNLSVSVSKVISVGRGISCDKTGIDDYVIKILDRLWKENWLKDPRVRNKRVPTCGYAQELVVNSNGDVYLCPLIYEGLSIGNIRNKSIANLCQEVKEFSSKYSAENIEKCQNCDLEYICGGGCRIKNITENGNIMKPTCTSKEINNYYKAMVEQNLKEYGVS